MRKVRPHSPDKIFLWTIIVFVIFGLLIFTSASFGLLVRGGTSFGNVLFSQLVLGLTFGLLAALLFYFLPVRILRKYSFHLFIISIVLSILVFVPGLGLELGGAKRWVLLGPITFQPAELLKFAFVMFYASWLASIGRDIETWKYGLLPTGVFLFLIGLMLVLQPDNGTLAIIFASCIGMFIVAGGRWKHLGLLILIGLVAFSTIAFLKPYVLERVTTFLNPDLDPLGSSYQVRQALIAIGSGEIFGKGLGQGVQKFNYLPEPTSDSIFAVLSEELGFVGALGTILLYLFFSIRGLLIAKKVPDTFSRLAIVGIVIIIVSQSFLNIGAMLGVFPLTGVPLLFISHGGTALMFLLAEVGFVLQMSRYTINNETI